MKKITILTLAILLLTTFAYATDIIVIGGEGQTKDFTIDNITYKIEFIVVGERTQLNINENPLVLDLQSPQEIKLNKKDVTVSLTSVLNNQANLKFEVKEENTTTQVTEQTLPGVTAVTASTLKNLLNKITLNPLKYIIGLIVIVIIIYFIYSSLDKDQEKRIEKYYRKAEEHHRTSEEYHEDGFPNLAEKSQQKAEKYRQKARETKINL